MWEIFRAGISILGEQFIAVLIFFVTILALGSFHLHDMMKDKPDRTLLLLAGMAVGYIDLVLPTYGLVWLNRVLPPLVWPVGFALFILPTAFFLRMVAIRIRSSGIPHGLMVVVGGFTLLLVVRLAFLQYLIVPPYSDSPIHYNIVMSFLNPGSISGSRMSLETAFTSYYHFGFHSIIAWLVSIAMLDPLKAIPLLGQLSLVVAPFSVAALTYFLTRSLSGAFFSFLLAAIGWSMPAFAANWGKYPALTAVALFPVALFMPFIQINKNYRAILPALWVLFGLTLIHTRILICLILAMISYIAASKFKFKSDGNLITTILYCISFALSLQPLFILIVDFYESLLVWGVLILLTPFAFQKKPQTGLAIILFLLGMDAIQILSQVSDIILLDRQFLGIILYIPLSLMGGIGFGELMLRISSNPTLQMAFSLILAACLLLNFQQNVSLIPDSCCNYFSRDDQLAFQWIEENKTPADLIIYSTFLDGGKIFGTDAGAWISPLSKTATNKFMFNTQWDSSSVFEELCSRSPTGAIYIYAGGAMYSFNKAQLNAQNWLKLVFESGNTYIYQSAQCN